MSETCSGIPLSPTETVFDGIKDLNCVSRRAPISVAEVTTERS